MADFDFPKTEEKLLKFWKERSIFQKSLENRKHAKRFVFFEGPPYANGRPGIHHFLGRALKDLFVRYKTMRGYLVERRAGWDTHGLPIEIEAEKRLGIKSKRDIEKIGVGAFNKKARESIWEYKSEWERFTHRIGFWLDLGNPYITYDPKYIETLWWIVKEIDKKKLLYKGHKVLPWCPRCGTALASHEVAQGYKDVTETSVYVRFRVKSNDPEWQKTSILSWTTTPWTLPGNAALAINPKHRFVCIPDLEYSDHWLVLEENSFHRLLAANLFPAEYKNLPADKFDTFDGKDMLGVEYEPLFDIPVLQSPKSYKVYAADFVTTDEGTGVVHTAVMYGEDDYELGQKLGLPKHHTVDPEGRFTSDVRGFESRYVKEAEKDIIEYLRSKNLLFKTESYTHSYPFCWRCDSALIYYARDSWFVAMSKLRKQLIKNNNKVNWVPEHLKHGRFGEFLKEAKDWAFSRERYWGTPLPVWQCHKCQNQLVVGSLEDLEKYRYRDKNTFFLMRHGQSTKDVPVELTASKLEEDHYGLTETGKKRVETQAEKIKQNGGLDLIFSSPFLRTKETAAIVAHKLGIKYHIDSRLVELDHGSVCENHSTKSCPMESMGRTMDNAKHEDGETWRQARRRMMQALLDIDRHHEGKRILIVGHGDPLWLLQTGVLGLDDDKTVVSRDELYFERGEVKKIDLKNFPYDENGELDLHRPYIDEIFLKCEKCQSKMMRMKEVVDVWFDSGSMPYAQWHYPFENKHRFAENFPADFIAEGIDMTRGWFYLLLAVSTVLGRGAPFKNVLSYNLVLDEKGQKMSKSRGNVVDPWVVLEQFGADATRWYFYTVNNPADSKLFSTNDVKSKMNSFVMTMLNSIRFFELYGKTTGKRIKAEAASVLDQWILSKLNNLTLTVGDSLDRYNPYIAGRAIENFVIEDLSNWWIRRSRQRFQKPNSAGEHQKTLQFFRFILSELSKIIAPFAPFLADHLYKKVNNHKESVHLEDWSKVQEKLINPELEDQMSQLRDLVAHGLAERKASGIKVRQPLAGVSVKRGERFDTGLEKLILEELNVKTIAYDPEQKEAVKIDKVLTSDLIIEGYAREVVRQVQDMRKEAGYRLDEKVFGAWESDNKEVVTAVEKFGKEIARDTLLTEFTRGHGAKEIFDVEKEFELGPQAKIWLGVRSRK